MAGNAATKYLKRCLFWLCLLPLTACAQQHPDISVTEILKVMNTQDTTTNIESKFDTATFAAGCFWCVEAQFSTLNGVEKVVSGFSGGHTPNPDYETVSTGLTGYAEACNIIYNPSVISYPELLAAFFIAHDPTQLNRQGNDVGTQYRSAIFYHNQKQKQLAEFYINKLNEAKAYPHQIVTKVSAYTKFYPADLHHQDYYNKNPNQPYCQYVIKPEMERFKKAFQTKLKQP